MKATPLRLLAFAFHPRLHKNSTTEQKLKHLSFIVPTMSSLRTFLILIIFPLFCYVLASQDKSICPFKYIYQFGDSLADTGNRIRQVGVVSVFNISSLPYGETYFHKPTGRYSDGLLVVDFVAKALHLPFLEPYLDKNASFKHGVNFAVGGSTALDNSYFAARNISIPSSNIPLSLQLQWFKKHLKSQHQSEKRLQESLFLIGEIGGNDYSNAFFQGKSMEEVKTYVPFVVKAITKAVKDVIKLGAVHIVVPGGLPGGCLPISLTSFSSKNHEDYDEMGCLRKNNDFSRFHSHHLQKALYSLRSEFPDVDIMYFDYFSAFTSILHHAPHLGFDKRSLLKACCGTGGMYNYDSKKKCGTHAIGPCSDPSKYLSWDGLHLTQEAYRQISHHFIDGVLSEFRCKLLLI